MLLLLSLGLSGGTAEAAMPPAGSVISARAFADYLPGDSVQLHRAYSNQTVAIVAAVESLTVTGDARKRVQPGASATVPYLLTNTGNVASQYSFGPVNLTIPACNADNTDLLSPRIVLDRNNNGVADDGEPALGSLTLEPGQAASLLIVGGAPNLSSGDACVGVRATTALQRVTAQATTLLVLGQGADLRVLKAAHYTGYLIPGQSVVSYTITATNNGTGPALGAASDGLLTQLIIAGAGPQKLIVIRDPIPEGTRYKAGTLTASMPGAIKLWRLSSDAPLLFRVGEPDISAAEVAVALPAGSTLVPGQSLQMNLSVDLLPGAGSGASSMVINQAHALYNDGGADTSNRSNPVVLPLALERIGLALAASRPSAIVADGTASVRFTATLRNYSRAPIYNAQISHVLEGITGSAKQFGLGAYSGSQTPGPSQYSVVPGSLRVTETSHGGTVASINPGFTGQASGGSLSRLLQAGAVLPAGGSLVVEFDVVINFLGRASSPLLTNATGQASRLIDAPAELLDLSTDGFTPDPTGQGPQFHGTPTPVPLPPSLGISKALVNLTRVGDASFDIHFRISVVNNGSLPAPGVRIVDNLACALSQAGVASWRLLGAPTARSGRLLINPGFTGNDTPAAPAGSGPCQAEVDTATGMPIGAQLAITDGTRALAPGQTEDIDFVVRATLRDPASTTIVNTGWVGSFDDKARLLAARAAKVQVLLSQPQGVVYDAISREPLAGAVVTLKRGSCRSGGATGAIALDQLANGTQYTANADGSVSMVTGSLGEYQFYWQSPPLDSLCEYQLSVAPPLGWRASQTIPPQQTTFQNCAAVVPNSTAPTGTQPTTWYQSFLSGVSNSKSCVVSNNHIPLDRLADGNLVGLEKLGSKKVVEFGDFIDYTLTVTNRSGKVLTGLSINDQLPPGFAYVSGSARLSGQPMADEPAGTPGPQLSFKLPTQSLPNAAKLTITYRVRVGVGAQTQGDAVNRAVAELEGFRSAEATWRVRITGGVFSDDAYAVGKVFIDCNRNGMQEPDELGVPGVRLFMENGVSVATDGFGRWSLYGLRPVTHVLKVDTSTLPVGSAPQIWDNRNAQRADSRFVDVKKGELAKADWPLSGCDDPAVLREVTSRRKAAVSAQSGTADRGVGLRIDASATPQSDLVADRRGSPAVGGNVFGGASEQLQSSSQATALIKLPTLNTNTSPATGATAPIVVHVGSQSPATHTAELAVKPATDGDFYLGALASAGTIDLEDLVSQLDAAPAFLDFQDGDVLVSAVTNVRVKGPARTQLELSVNGRPVDVRRVGKKTTQTETGVAAWEYIGVELKPGSNELVLTVRDDMGIARGQRSIAVKAPGGLSKILLRWPEIARADPLEPVDVTVRLADANGLPVTARTAVSLETDRGQWLTSDLNQGEPGLQLFVSNGEATVQLRPPIDPGPVTLRARTGTLGAQLNARFSPAQRPLIGVGIVEGVVDFTNRGKLTLGAPGAADAFEQELRSAVRQDGDSRSAGRLAFFFKGTVKGEYLLTAGYDSDKRYRDRLFRDIKADEYYPVYGDDSTRAFDGQSTQRLYVRIDKDRSYLLLGDFSTASSAEVRQLTQVNRNLSGVKHQYETDDLRITSFASEDSTRQQIEELRANGLSFYFLGGAGDLVPNTERVEILVRSAGQPQIVLSTRQLSRGADYSFDVLSRKLVLAQPLPSFDANLNPQSLRVSYEVDAGGPKFVVAGVDAQVKVNPQLQVGAVAVKDSDPANQRTLAGLTAIAKIDEHTIVAAEAAYTESDLKGKGRAARVELRHADETFKGQLQASRSGTGFDNPSALGGTGRTEVTGSGEYLLNERTRLRAELQFSAEDALTSGQASPPHRENASVAVQHKINDLITVEGGVRFGNTASTTAGSFAYGQTAGNSTGNGSTNPTGVGTSTGSSAISTTSARARVTARFPELPQAEFFAEAEQDLERRDGHALGVGGSYALTDQTRIYGRYGLIDSMDANATDGIGNQRVTSVLGIDTNFGSGSRLYNEARWGEANTQNATGLRHSIRLGEAWRLSGGVEHTRVVGGSGGTTGTATESTALTLGADYLLGSLRGSTAAEWRTSAGSESALLALGAAYRFNDDWVGLARAVATRTSATSSNGNNTQLVARQQLGLAWRPADIADFNALLRFENRYERGVGTPGLAAAADPTLVTRTQMLSALGNLSLSRGSVLTGRWAGKRASVTDSGGQSSYWAQLVHGRYTRDLSQDWDMGVQAGLMWAQGGARQQTAGVELGYQVMPNLWFSGGYNVLGIKEPDLTSGEYTSQGFYLRLRFKFDESTFGLESPVRRRQAPAVTPVAVPEPPAPVPVVPQDAPKPVATEPKPAQVKVLSAQTLFATNQHQLSADGKSALRALVDELRGTEVDLILVVGHTDSTGSDAYNQDLSERRATSVRTELMSLGMQPETVRAEGRGEREPIASNRDAAGRAANRRVEIHVNPPPTSDGTRPRANVALTVQPGVKGWQATDPWPRGQVTFQAEQLFAGADSHQLSAAGRALLDAVAAHLVQQQSSGQTAVTVSVGHGASINDDGRLWQARASAIRRALADRGAASADAVVDTQWPAQGAVSASPGAIELRVVAEGRS